MKGSVLVIGAGIAGINAALELTAQGYKVVLVEKKPTIGGRMAQLDKMFPSDECGMCTILPKLLEVTSNPNIQLMAFCEVQSVEGAVGDFKVKILKNPRYVDPMKCNACTECFPACPVGGVPIEFNYGRGSSKAISFYSPFPPRKALIYPEYCTYLKEGKCGEGEKPPCVEACKPEAIDFNQKPTVVEVNVGAIIVSTGLDVYLPTEMNKFGYGKYKNVLTSIEYERLLSGIGPTAGVVKRDDGTIPKRVAWIQCVGPKNLKRGSTYCSAVCCMAATTEALGTLDREKESEVFIIHDDIVGYAKGFQEHYHHAQESGVKYLRGKVENVSETDNGDIILSMKYPSKKTEEIKVNMLVLSTNLIPSKDDKELATRLDIKLDDQGFFKEQDTVYEPLKTTREGIFISGTAQGPKDISESIAQACGAASGAAAILKDVRGTEIVKPPEKKFREVKVEDEPKIGVILCDCGSNIAGFIDMDELMEYAKSLPNVAVVDRDLFACGGAKYKEMIANNDINRTVVVACSPKTHEHLFQLHTENAGLNKYLMELVNARNHCSWVHTGDKSLATEKAKTLLRMGVARTRLLEPLNTIETKVNQNCLVIGGGVSGMVCANRLADMGYDVHLVDKNKKLGGKLQMLNKAYMADSRPSEYIDKLSKTIIKKNNITTHLDAEIKEIDGFIGQFNVTISKGGDKVEQLDVGAVVVATGAQELKPDGKFMYGKNKNVVTHLDLEYMLNSGAFELKDDAYVTMISCVDAKQKDPEGVKSYCCNIGCENMLKNAQTITTLKPDAKVHILHRDWTLPHKNAERGRLELDKQDNVEFIRYSTDKPPTVSEDLTVSLVKADDNAPKTIKSDLIVLTTPPIASEDNIKLKEQLGVCLEPNNFFMGALGKLKPLDFTADGIFLCGTAHSPKGISCAIAEGEGVASRVATIISHDVLQKEPTLSFVVDEKCDGCAYCIDPCVFNAITLFEYMYEGNVKKTVDVNEAVCKGCGVCMATCPKDGIYIRHFKPEHFKAMIHAALEVTT